MDIRKTKSLALEKLKISEPDEGKERRVTFVASSSNEDRDYETVDIGSFRLPLKGGGEVLVRDLGASGSENVDVPLLTDHNHWEVEKVIGSVRRALYQDGKLIFEAGISERDYARDVFKLIEEGHLDNAFSISFRDYDYNGDANKISNGEIIEVSLVTRGSNKDAQVLEVKALKGEKAVDQETTPADKPAETPAVESTVANTNADIPAENTADESTTNTEEAPKEEQPVEEKSVDINDTKEKSMHDLPDHKAAAAAQVKMPSQGDERTSSSTGKDYLKSKQAERDFARHIHDNYGQPSSVVLKSWGEKVAEKGITGDSILPSRIENVFFKAWEDLTSPLSTFYRMRKLTGAFNAFSTTDTAKRHKKGGADKTSQNISNKRRDYKAVMIYKMLEIDLEDLILDEDGELTILRNEELSERINGQIVKAAIVGDGLETTDDGALFDGTRGLFSIKGDLDESATTGTYASLVATVLNDTDNPAANMYEKIMLTLSAVKGGEGEKVVFVQDGTLAQLSLMKNENGGYLFPAGTDFEKTFKARIFEADYVAGSGYDVIAYRSNKYGLPMGDMMVRTGFDMKTNKDAMLQERMVAGSLFGSKVAAGYKSKA